MVQHWHNPPQIRNKTVESCVFLFSWSYCKWKSRLEDTVITPHERADAFMEDHPVLIILIASAVIALTVSLGFLGIYKV
jgi:hypothetical protein